MEVLCYKCIVFLPLLVWFYRRVYVPAPSDSSAHWKPNFHLQGIKEKHLKTQIRNSDVNSDMYCCSHLQGFVDVSMLPEVTRKQRTELDAAGSNA